MPDNHRGFDGVPKPDAHGAQQKAVSAVNNASRDKLTSSSSRPTCPITDAPIHRRKRLSKFRGIALELGSNPIHIMPEEQDAALDSGNVHREFYSDSHFYGHVHAANHHMTGHNAHHAAKSPIFPLPAPGSQSRRTPVP
jgi:hypothetical protein